LEVSWLLILKVAAFLTAVLAVIGIFVKLSWLTKLRLTAALLVGIILIGVLAWPIAAPSEPSGAVFFGSITRGGAIALAALAFFAGLVAYFLSWPYGREMGILAVPAGLTVWSVCSGSMADLLKLHPGLGQREALFSGLKWEPVFWLAIVAAGFAGVLLGWKIRSKAQPDDTRRKPNSKTNMYFSAAFALVFSFLFAQFFIRLLARDVGMSDPQLGSVVAQPAVGQIAFAVSVSFGIAAFVVRKFLGAGYIWPILAGGFVTAVAVNSYVKQNVLQYLAEQWPPIFFSNAVISILPVQMVAFGTLGSIAGYWLAVRYEYWRKHE
jgi:hypothetical protein